MKLINGWSEEDRRLLKQRTGQPPAAIEHFCQALDKQLYLMLPAHIKKATLHFHLGARKEAVSLTNGKLSQDENIVRLQEYLRHRKAR